MSAELLNVTPDSLDEVEKRLHASFNTSAAFHRHAEVDEIKRGVRRDVFRRKEERREVAHLLK